MNDLVWFKSSYSDSGGGECVEVAVRPGAAVHIRDSKEPHGPVLAFEPSAWADFIGYVSVSQKP
ncbi:DUF397 domain-containing protein [Streptomyces sp. 8N616]|uniref:DUF397 domain-containing protein n=1 Tax=Streptomyces sp. 8N616 TaxID=3457414 RepID=UPI003FCF478D